VLQAVTTEIRPDFIHALRDKTLDQVTATVEVTNLTCDLERMLRQYESVLLSMTQNMATGPHAFRTRYLMRETLKEAFALREQSNRTANRLLTQLFS
jgi:hypothetical protein